MARHVALIRGINVGRAKRVAMAELRAVVTDLGYRDVRTLLNSGNVVFTAPAAVRGDSAARIAGAIATRLGVTARVIVISAEELAAVVRRNPLSAVADDHSRLLVAVFDSAADRVRLGPLVKTDWAPDALSLGTRVAYMWCARGILESPLAKAATRALGDAATTRNWATLTKLHALATEEQT